MGDAKICDRCGRFYSIELFSINYEEKWWRYEITKDNHPYGAEKVDLCIDCRKKLYKWLKGEISE